MANHFRRDVVLSNRTLGRSLALGLLCCALVGTTGFAQATVNITSTVKLAELRCEYLQNPLGLDVAQPRLSWKLEAGSAKDRGTRQTAYQVLVASTDALLAKNRGDLWDSGVVNSDQSVLVSYAGQPLKSGMVCYWKVRVRDHAGALTPWSAPGSWTMGLLSKSDWTAKWIGTDQVFVRRPGWPPPDNAMPDPWFRKSFNLERKPRRATVYIASVGYHELYVNGRKIGGQILCPSVTDHTKRARYVTYDITSALRPGKNVLGLWLGVSWSIFPPHQTKDKPASPIVIAQADIDTASGQHLIISTDETWKTHPSPNTLVGVWDFMHFGGEVYDARQELANWCALALDDSSWKAATMFKPNLELSAEKVEANRLVKAVRPVAVQELSNHVYRVDMGVNFAGWIEMDLKGQPGDRIDFRFSENPKEAMTHRLHSAYVLGPTGRGKFRDHFNYGVGRWIQIEGLRQKPDLTQIRGWLVRTDYRRTGNFECSNPLLNQIYQTTLWTFENLSLGGYVVDCPQRERMGYGGDAHATISTALDNYDLGAFYTKWSEDWRDAQKPDGNLPYTAPTYWGGGGPGWSGFCITLPWQIYCRYGDRRILEVNFETIQRWLAFLETKSKNNLLARWGGEWDFLGDWLWPGADGVNGDTRETLFFNNCYWIYNLQTAARIAEVLGKIDAAAAYRSRADEVRQAVHKEFYKPDQHSYVNGYQAYLAIALLTQVPPESERAAVWKRLENEIQVVRKDHIWAGITGGAFLFKALLENDRQDLIYPMAIQQDYPGWGDMLRQGATTFWESWEGKLSLLHSSYLYIGAWFTDGLAGIKVDSEAPGFKRFIIKPGVLANHPVEWVKARYDSIYGPITSNWRFRGNKFELEVNVPPNTSAIVYVPANNPGSLREGNRRLDQVAGVERVREDAGRVVLRVQPGNYTFSAE